MNTELHQWAILQAIASGAGPRHEMIVEAAAAFVAFVQPPVVAVAEPVTPAIGRWAAASAYEAAFDVGEKPRHAAERLGTTAGKVSGAYARIRRARGIPPMRSGNPNQHFGRKQLNGAVHS